MVNWDDVARKITDVCGSDAQVRREVPLSDYTTFKIGGPAALLVEPSTREAMVAVVKACAQLSVPLRILGLGSDLLVADEGLRCVVMRIAENYSAITINDCTLVVQAGASNALVAEAACEAGLAGYEFASGIPGTVGGAAIMNAGAYDGEFKDVCTQLSCITPEGACVTVSAQEADWGYRHSMMDSASYLVESVTLQLQKADTASVQAKIDELTEKRQAKQPLEMPSAGSTFKRPEGYFAGKLIQDAGLRGFMVGGAQVSTKHTGFVVNAGGATAQDVRDLIAQVQQRVYDNEGVQMHPEVRLWTDSNEPLDQFVPKASE